MKIRINTILITSVVLSAFSAFGEEIIPKGWLTHSQLEQAERPIQEQLDTGKDMSTTAYHMAALRDARLLLTYLHVYELLPSNADRNQFKSEQQAWLEERHKSEQALANPNGGSIVKLNQASRRLELTNKRIEILQTKLARLNKTK